MTNRPSSFAEFMSIGKEQKPDSMTPDRPIIGVNKPAGGPPTLDSVMRITPTGPGGQAGSVAKQRTFDMTAQGAMSDISRNRIRRGGPSADANSFLGRAENRAKYEALVSAAKNQTGGEVSDGRTIVLPVEVLDGEGGFLGADEGKVSESGEVPLMLQAFPDRISLVEKENPENVVFTGPVSHGAVFGVGSKNDTAFVPDSIDPNEAQVDTTEKSPIEAFRFNISDLSTILNDFYDRIVNFEIMSPEAKSAFNSGVERGKADRAAAFDKVNSGITRGFNKARADFPRGSLGPTGLENAVANANNKAPIPIPRGRTPNSNRVTPFRNKRLGTSLGR